MNSDTGSASGGRLAQFAKVVVAVTFVVLLIGGHTTTTGAGMAFPDWPLSRGSINPDGWWKNAMESLEHGHRYVAESVGVLIGVLCAWIWRSPWSVPISLLSSAALAALAAFAGASKPTVAHIGLWSSVPIFLVLLWRSFRYDPAPRAAVLRWLALAAFGGVCIQAVLGGMRVIHDPAGALAGSAATATAFRIFHACFAQLELCVLVTIAAMLSPIWLRLRRDVELRGVERWAWITAAAIFLQLVAGASMRHLGAGLAIPTFPLVDGGWSPTLLTPLVLLNFGHTRIGALLVAALVLVLVRCALTTARGQLQITRPATLLVTLVIVQIAMGVMVIWQLRPPILTTLHVVNGAALLSTTVLLAVRAGRAAGGRPAGAERSAAELEEVTA